MGISGLWPLIKEAISPIHLKELKGCKVAVDAYVWIYKGFYTCPREVAKGIPTDRFVNYFMKWVKLLQMYDIKPLLVFDGDDLPSKKVTDDYRTQLRIDALKFAEENVNGGKNFINYHKACHVQPEHAHQIIRILEREGIEYIVAPYEADAQLAYLCREAYVDAVISEDSDLIVFGCPKIIRNFTEDGSAECFKLSDLKKNRKTDFRIDSLSHSQIIQMCILSGCDYLPSVRGVGLKSAYQMICKTHQEPMDLLMKRLIMKKGSEVPMDYPSQFEKAYLTFLHQRVYDPRSNTIVHLSDFPDVASAAALKKFENLDFLGASIPQDILEKHVKSRINPITKQPYADENDVFAYSAKENRPINSRFPHVKPVKFDKQSIAISHNNRTINSYFKTVSAVKHENATSSSSLFMGKPRPSFIKIGRPAPDFCDEYSTNSLLKIPKMDTTSSSMKDESDRNILAATASTLKTGSESIVSNSSIPNNIKDSKNKKSMVTLTHSSYFSTATSAKSLTRSSSFSAGSKQSIFRKNGIVVLNQAFAFALYPSF